VEHLMEVDEGVEVEFSQLHTGGIFPLLPP
jgi:hypothetical protein